MESGAEALAGAGIDTTVSSTCAYCIPVVILHCISQPVANQLLEDLEGRPRALGIKGGVMHGSAFQLLYHACLSSGIHCHVM